MYAPPSSTARDTRRSALARLARRAALTGVLTGVLAGILTVGHGAAPRASAAESTLPVEVRSSGDDLATASLPVPEGVVPTALFAQVSTESTGGSVVVLVGGREAGVVPPGEDQDVAIPVLSTDVVDGAIEVGLRQELEPSATGCPPMRQVSARLFDLRLTYAGTEVPATSAEGFFPPVATRIDVHVPRTADDDVLTAGLTAVATLASVYPQGTRIVLGSPGVVLPRTGLGQRILQLVSVDEGSADGASVETISQYGLQRLVITGTGPELQEAVRDLAPDLVALAEDHPRAGLRVPSATRSPEQAVALGDLGLPDAPLVGAGLTNAEVEVSQDLFGGRVDELRIHLEGTHTALGEDISAQLNTYVDDDLVDSTLLGDGTRLEADTVVPGWQLSPRSRVRFSLAILPVDGACSDAETLNGLEVSLDPVASTISAGTGGSGPSSFGVYPQVLGGTVPVALRRSGRQRVVAAGQAAELVASLQREAGAPLEVQVVDLEEIVDGRSPGLLVGAAQRDARALGAPVPLGPFNRVDTGDTRLGIGRDDPYAALEVTGSEQQPVVLLGSWSPGSQAVGNELVQALLDRVRDDGWSSLPGTVLVAPGGARTIALDLAPTGPPPLPPGAEDAPAGVVAAAWWLVPGSILLGLVLALQVWIHQRRERRPAVRDDVEPSLTSS